MKATFKIDDRMVKVDLSNPLDISITLEASKNNPLAWYLDIPKIEPVKTDNWIGKVSEGASVNFNNISFNPHAHGTHTECIGHITPEFHSVNEVLKNFFFITEVISVVPENAGEDRVISGNQIKNLLDGKHPEALVIRTLPNMESKKVQDYSNSNWPYLKQEAATFIREIGIQHLLIDLPSVDKEKDDGKLLAHKAFWGYPQSPRLNATITELIYVPDHIEDGRYLLNLQIAPFHNDASPSKPVLYHFL